MDARDIATDLPKRNPDRSDPDFRDPRLLLHKPHRRCEAHRDGPARALGSSFPPEVFKRKREGEKAKGVDIALSKDLLSHAYLDNYDVAVLDRRRRGLHPAS